MESVAQFPTAKSRLVRPRRENILTVFALENEAQGQFAGWNAAYVGVGKINAAYGLMRQLADWRALHGRNPELVLNLGSAGSPFFKAGSLVNCTTFYQRDMDVTPLGFAPHQTPFDDTPVPLHYGARYADFPDAICGSGDHFVDDPGDHPWQVMDMEAFALALICQRENIPFGCLKFISDGADGNAANDWEKALKQGAILLREAVSGLFA